LKRSGEISIFNPANEVDWINIWVVLRIENIKVFVAWEISFAMPKQG
jgi:hypothetical protein